MSDSDRDACPRDFVRAAPRRATRSSTQRARPTGVFSFALPGEKKLQTPGPARRRRPRARRARLRLPQPRREPRAASTAGCSSATCGCTPSPSPSTTSATSTSTPGCRSPRSPRRARPAARLGAAVRRRVVQRDPRARLRLLDPQGVGVAASRAASRPATSRPSGAGSRRARPRRRSSVLRRSVDLGRRRALHGMRRAPRRDQHEHAADEGHRRRHLGEQQPRSSARIGRHQERGHGELCRRRPGASA